MDRWREKGQRPTRRHWCCVMEAFCASTQEKEWRVGHAGIVPEVRQHGVNTKTQGRGECQDIWMFRVPGVTASCAQLGGGGEGGAYRHTLRGT